MRDNTLHIHRSYFNSSNHEGGEVSQTRAILETTVRLIKSDIKTKVKYVNDQISTPKQRHLLIRLYPAFDNIPESLRIVSKALFVVKDTAESYQLMHAIIQTVRPRADISPLQIVFSVQIHHLNMSFSCGYLLSYEVLLFQWRTAEI